VMFKKTRKHSSCNKSKKAKSFGVVACSPRFKSALLLVSQDSYQTPLRSCKNHPGVLGSIFKREEPRETGAPYIKVPVSSTGPNPPSERRKLELRLERHLRVLSFRPSLTTCSAVWVFITAVPIILLFAWRGKGYILEDM
jgi:hypothetical protein